MSHFDLKIVLEKMLNSTFRLLPRKVCSLIVSSGTIGLKYFWWSSHFLSIFDMYKSFIKIRQAFLKAIMDPSQSSIYSWSILEHEFFCLGRLGSSGHYGKKEGFEFFWATFESVFFNFLCAKNKFFKNIVMSSLKSRIKKVL